MDADMKVYCEVILRFLTAAGRSSGLGTPLFPALFKGKLYTHTDTHTHRHTQRHTDRQTHRQTDRHTHIHTHTELIHKSTREQLGLPRWLSSKESVCPCRSQEMRAQFLGQGDPLEKEMASHSSLLAYKNPKERGAWQVTGHGAARVGQD